jgi:IS5 family transposase
VAHQVSLLRFVANQEARTPYGFGVKVTVATTLKEGFVVGMRSMQGNPYDGHTLGEAIEQVSILADHKPKTVIVDRGHRGELVRVWFNCVGELDNLCAYVKIWL